MTRSDYWTTTSRKSDVDENAKFCTDNCPHSNETCRGDCPEMKEWRKMHKKETKRCMITKKMILK